MNLFLLSFLTLSNLSLCIAATNNESDPFWAVPYAGGKRRAFGVPGIAAMVCFSILAICLCAGAIYLLAKNKNISDVLEDAVDDGICSCVSADSAENANILSTNQTSVRCSSSSKI